MNRITIKTIAQSLRDLTVTDNGSLALSAAVAYNLPVLPASTDFKFVFRQQYESKVASLISAVNELQVVNYQVTLDQVETMFVNRMRATYSPQIKVDLCLTEENCGVGFQAVYDAVAVALK